MKAAIFENIGKIKIKEVKKPTCSDDSILVKVKGCGICGSDIRNYRVGLKDDIKNQVMGHEIAGIIEETGSKIRKFKSGDNIAITPDVSCGICYYCKREMVNLCLKHKMIGTHWPGGFAQYIHLSSEILEHGIISIIPAGVSLYSATISEPASSVIAAQENAGICPGDTVLIIGDGPMGCLHVEIARTRGVTTIIMAGLNRLKDAAMFKPDYLIDVKSQDIVNTVLEITGGLGVDVAICATSVAETHNQAVRSVRKRGKVIIFGGLPRTQPMSTLNSNLIHYNEISIIGSFSYTNVAHRQALSTIKNKKIDTKKYIKKIVSLEEIENGFKIVESGQCLKVLVDPWL
jgi:L-iditol 2-dehydrogenase